MTHKKTDETTAAVKALAAHGVPQDDISEYIGISKHTLINYYSKEMAESRVEAKSKVAKFLFHAASGDAMADGATHGECIRAAIFYAKTQMGWRETDEKDNSDIDKLANAITAALDRLPN